MANDSRKPKKFIFITGGVASSLGKGLAAALAGTGFVDPQVAHDTVKPGIQPGARLPLAFRLDGAFKRAIAAIRGLRRRRVPPPTARSWPASSA